jgi:hypothetical protein
MYYVAGKMKHTTIEGVQATYQVRFVHKDIPTLAEAEVDRAKCLGDGAETAEVFTDWREAWDFMHA